MRTTKAFAWAVLVLAVAGDAYANAADGQNGDGVHGGNRKRVDGQPGARVTAGAHVSLRAFCEASYAARAAWNPWIEDCCLPSAAELLAFPLGDYNDQYIDDCVAHIQESVDAGSVVFHGEFAQACAEHENAAYPRPPEACSTLASNTLDAYYAQPSRPSLACEAAFEGKLGVGEQCKRDVECESGLACYEVHGAFVCGPASGVGGPCSDEADCEAGMYCVGPVQHATCAAQLGTAGAPCGFSDDCATGFACNPIDHECFQAGQVGDSCEVGGDCATEPKCLFVRSKCARLALSVDGTPCSSDYECKSGWCNPELEACASICSE